mgnify:CR=1 FL=1
MKLARNDPATPSTAVMMKPSLSSPGLSARASKPAMNPMTMVQMMAQMLFPLEVLSARGF